MNVIWTNLIEIVVMRELWEKIDHAVQARTYITHKVLNDFIQKATKAEINKKIYQSRLKKAQNQQQQQPQVQ